MSEIQQMVERYVESIHTQNEQEFRSLWSGEDTDTMISVTQIYRGLDSIVSDFLIGAIRKSYTEITLIPDSEPEIHQLTDDVAIVIFCYHTECIKRDDGSSFGISGVETQVMKRIGSHWKLCHIHYSQK